MDGDVCDIDSGNSTNHSPIEDKNSLVTASYSGREKYCFFAEFSFLSIEKYFFGYSFQGKYTNVVFQVKKFFSAGWLITDFFSMKNDGCKNHFEWFTF